VKQEVGSVTVARIVAESTDDVYRILHACFLPLERHIGTVPYSDRIYGLGSDTPLAAVLPMRGSSTSRSQAGSTSTSADEPAAVALTANQHAAVMQLTDATLPTGGFAHSGGIEAAMQLGLFRSTMDEQELVRRFILAAARSTLRLQGAFALAAHDMVYNTGSGDQRRVAPDLIDHWDALDARLHAHLVANAVACRASTQQGTALSRVLAYWLPSLLLEGLPPKLPRAGHMATIFGLAGGLMGLPRGVMLQALVHCTVRDATSAAVRLNLLGPLAAVGFQASVMRELLADVSAAQAAPPGLEAAAGCAPLVECAHAAHDLLEARLFVT